jgi:hypothetical protein
MSDEHRQKEQTSKTDYCTALSSLSPSHHPDHPDSYTFWPDLGGKRLPGKRKASSLPEQKAGNSIPHVITESDDAYLLFSEQGFNWGGHWYSPIDYQHFEWD